MNTLDDAIDLPCTFDLDDGDVFIDTATGTAYTLTAGAWKPATTDVAEQAFASYKRCRHAQTGAS